MVAVQNRLQDLIKSSIIHCSNPQLGSQRTARASTRAPPLIHPLETGRTTLEKLPHGAELAAADPISTSQQSFVELVESRMRLEAGLGSRATTGSGDAGAHPSSPAEGNELEGSPEHASPGRPQPPAGSQPRSELEELRYRLAEQEEQLAWMNEKLARVSPGPPAPAERQGGYELTVYQPKSTGISL